MRRGADCWRLVGFDGLAAVEDPVDEVEHGEDDREALARQFVDASSVVLAVMRRSGRRRQRRRQRSRHHRLRLLMLMVMPVMWRQLGRGGPGPSPGRGASRTGWTEEWLVDACYHWNAAVHSAATGHGRITDRRVRTAVTGSVRMRLYRQSDIAELKHSSYKHPAPSSRHACEVLTLTLVIHFTSWQIWRCSVSGIRKETISRNSFTGVLISRLQISITRQCLHSRHHNEVRVIVVVASSAVISIIN